MNRIYQGRVTRVEIPDPATKGKEWLVCHTDLNRARHLTTRIPELRGKVESEMAKRADWTKDERKQRPKSKELQEYEDLRAEQREQWESTLWFHHELFQDTVNYYLSAFAAMVDRQSASGGLREFREAVVRSWEKHVQLDGSWQRRILGQTLSGQAAWKAFEKRIFSMTGSRKRSKLTSHDGRSNH